MNNKDCINCKDCKYCKHCEDCEDCEDCKDCKYCEDCAWLSNKQYCISNKQYTKEEYFNLISKK